MKTKYLYVMTIGKININFDKLTVTKFEQNGRLYHSVMAWLNDSIATSFYLDEYRLKFKRAIPMEMCNFEMVWFELLEVTK